MKTLIRALVGCAIFFAPALPVNAAVLLYVEGPSAAPIGAEVAFRLKAKLTDSVNAIKTTVLVSAGAEPSVRFDDTDSVMRLWLQRGTAVEGGIVLEGVIPGGVGPAFSDVVDLGTLWVTPTGVGEISVRFSDSEIYLNQPMPTLSGVTSSEFVFRAAPSDGSAGAASREAVVLDADVRIVRDPLLADGVRSVVFDVKTDRGTADIVRIRERWFGIWGTWRDAQSPSTLSDGFGVSILDVALTGPFGSAAVVTIVPLLLKILWSIIAVLIGASAVRFLKQRH